jgi:hypothetical protein
VTSAGRLATGGALSSGDWQADGDAKANVCRWFKLANGEARSPILDKGGFVSKWYFHGPSPHYLVVVGSVENFQPPDGVTLYLIIEHQWGSFAEHIISQEIATCILF